MNRFILQCRSWFYDCFCQSPAGLLFARPIYEGGYVTVMDVFKQKYGDGATSVLFCLHCLSSILYGAAILTALGIPTVRYSMGSSSFLCISLTVI